MELWSDSFCNFVKKPIKHVTYSEEIWQKTFLNWRNFYSITKTKSSFNGQNYSYFLTTRSFCLGVIVLTSLIIIRLPLWIPIILESKYFGTFKFISNEFMFNHVISCSFMSFHFISFPKKFESFQIIWNQFQITSKKIGKIPKKLESILKHFHKNWKSSKNFGIISKKNWNQFQIILHQFRNHFASI